MDLIAARTSRIGHSTYSVDITTTPPSPNGTSSITSRLAPPSRLPRTLALDLKRSLPHIPLATVFRPYRDAGKKLADLHLNYESVDRYKLDWEATRSSTHDRVEKMLPKGKVDSAEGNYKVYETLKYNDTFTLHGIPERAFAYRLGNRSASIGSSNSIKVSSLSVIVISCTTPTATATTPNTSSNSSSASSPSACAPSTS